MHFAITGAKGTGKSCLLEAVATRAAADELFRNIEFLDSPGSKAKRLGHSLGKMGSDQTHMFFASMHLKSIQPTANAIRVLDRCLVDHLAYVRLLSLDSTLIEMMEELTRVASKSYSVVFVTRLYDGLPPLVDTTEDDEFREQIELEILRILNEFGISHLELSGPVDNSAKRVLETVRQLPGVF